MKRLALIIVIVCGSIVAFAQSSNVVSAWNYLKNGDFEKAKEMIEPAIQNEKTKAAPKTWYYRGRIYEGLYDSVKMDISPLATAVESYKKSLEIDPKNDWADELKVRLAIIANEFYKTGSKHFNKKEYDEALKSFQGMLLVNPNDTSSILNCAIAAYRANNLPVTKQYYSQIVKMKYKDPKVYNSFANIYLAEKDTENYYSVVKQGLALYPDDKDLMSKELFYMISTNKISQAIDGLNTALQKDPKNTTLIFALASIYDKISYDNSKKGDTVEFNKNFVKAEDNYKRAIEIKPDYFEANFNLGAMYFNLAADMINKANEIDASKVKEYDAAKSKYDIRLKQAQPYLEKAHEIQPKDDATMNSLRQLYAHLNLTDKANEMKKQMDANK